MKRKIKIGLFVTFILLLIFVAVLIEQDTKPNVSYTFDVIKNITIENDPNLELLKFASPCLLDYGESIGIFVGMANSAEEAVYKVRTNANKLSEKYSDRINNNDLIEHYWFDVSGEKIFVKYRTEREKYPKTGWYITVIDDKSLVIGDFFLSNRGILMPASRRCSAVDCCI